MHIDYESKKSQATETVAATANQSFKTNKPPAIDKTTPVMENKQTSEKVEKQVEQHKIQKRITITWKKAHVGKTNQMQ